VHHHNPRLERRAIREFSRGDTGARAAGAAFEVEARLLGAFDEHDLGIVDFDLDAAVAQGAGAFDDGRGARPGRR
jgi:hypothetical protein